jgi:hypothetical protein
MHNIALTYMKLLTTESGKDILAVSPVATLRMIEPFYTFNFDLHPPRDFRKWKLLFTISFSNRSEDSGQSDGTLVQEPSLELGAVATVVELALRGRLETIRQCEVPDCGVWFTSKKNDPTRRCCPAHSTDDLRKGTPERKEQLRAAAKASREREIRVRERAEKNLPKWGEY